MYSYDEYSNPVYFNTLLLIIYLSAIEMPICHKEIEFHRVQLFRFFTKYDICFFFQNTVLKSYGHCLRQMS